jgi:biotin-(acetyl-CoA carboxylase) ligase
MPIPREAPRLKWPNDLMSAARRDDPRERLHPLGRKLGGILIESVSVGRGASR